MLSRLLCGFHFPTVRLPIIFKKRPPFPFGQPSIHAIAKAPLSADN